MRRATTTCGCASSPAARRARRGRWRTRRTTRRGRPWRTITRARSGFRGKRAGRRGARTWALMPRNGNGLYKDRQIGVAVLKNGQWMQPAGDLTKALPGAANKGRRQNNVRVPPIEPGAESAQGRRGGRVEARQHAQQHRARRVRCRGARLALRPLAAERFPHAARLALVQLGDLLRRREMGRPDPRAALATTCSTTRPPWSRPGMAACSSRTPAITGRTGTSSRKAPARRTSRSKRGTIPSTTTSILSRLALAGAPQPAKLVPSKNAPKARPRRHAGDDGRARGDRALPRVPRLGRREGAAHPARRVPSAYGDQRRRRRMTARSRTCGVTPSTWRRWIGSAAATTTMAPAASTRGGSRRRRPTRFSCPARSIPCSPTSAA